MWFLFLAVASFLAFPSIMLLLWLADTLEAHQRHSKRKVHAERRFSVLSIAQAFEPVFAALWEAPIQALELIQSGGTIGIPVSRLRPIFNKVATRLPEIYEGNGFEQWLKFLQDNGLIDWSGQKVTLTPEGREFLDYRFTTEALVLS
jgi:hypothetical protein